MRFKSTALNIRLREEWAYVARDVNVAQFGVDDVGQRHAVGAIAGDVRQQQAFQRFLRRNIFGINQFRAVGHANIREAKVSAQRKTSESLHRIIRRVQIAGAGQVDFQKTATQNLKVIA